MNFRISGALLLTLALLWGCGGDDTNQQTTQDKSQKNGSQQEQKQAPPPLPAKVVTVNHRNIPIWIEYTGKTEASQRVEVRARVSGKLEQVLFKEGDLVEKGQKLFVIEKASYQAEVDKANAKLAADQASLNLARADVARYQPLVAEGLAPRVTLEQNQAKVAELEAAIRADQAEIDNAELNLSYTDVLAPSTGRISRKNIDIGNIVGFSEKTLLTTIVSDDPMYAYFSPSEEQYQIIETYRSKTILDARVTVPSNNSTLLKRKPSKGVVDFQDNRVNSMTGTISMRASVPNPDRKLLEGTFVYVDLFVTDKANFMMVPPKAIMEDQQGSHVFVIGENNSVVRKNVTTGFDSKFYVVVNKGLDDGAKVIINGLTKIRPGMTVAPKDVTETEGVVAVLKANDMIPEKE